MRKWLRFLRISGRRLAFALLVLVVVGVGYIGFRLQSRRPNIDFVEIPTYWHGFISDEKPLLPALSLSQEEAIHLDTFVDTLEKQVVSGELSREEADNLAAREEAVLLTKGMSAWQAIQYIHQRAPHLGACSSMFANQALVDNPDDFDALLYWAGWQPYAVEGPNPEREAACEKLFSMEGVPGKKRAVVLENFARTVWYYKPGMAVCYFKAAEALGRNYSPHDLAFCYQRLGLYDKALEVLKPHSRILSVYESIQALEAGAPGVRPIWEEARPVRKQADAVSERVTSAPALSDKLSLGVEEVHEVFEVLEVSKDRIRSAMGVLKRYGHGIGLRRLRAMDPRLAREIDKHLNRDFRSVEKK